MSLNIEEGRLKTRNRHFRRPLYVCGSISVGILPFQSAIKNRPTCRAVF
ncbi:hypothetical protein [Neisseria sicca]|nr:hypothetical protein [Neisseria sicca]